MKNYISLLKILFLFFIVNEVHSQNYWTYPIVPGTEEWTKLKSEKEIIAAQQIPENVLKNMSTDEVFQAWLDLPGRIEILAFNTLQEGFNVARKRFNVLNELLGRKDAGTIIIKKYSTFTPSDIKNEWESKTKGKFITDLAFLEFLLSQPEVLESLTKTQKKYLFDKVKLDLEKKKSFPKEDYDFFWINTGLILAARVLEKENIQFQNELKFKKELSRPLIKGDIFSKKEFESLLQAVNTFSF